MQRPLMMKMIDRLAPKEGLLLMIMAAIVGGVTGLAAVFFIHLISAIEVFFYGGADRWFPSLGSGAFILVPVIGGLIGGPIIAYWALEAKGHGVPQVMQALVLRGGRIRRRVAGAKIIASALCIGTGGSAGREGPIIQVGSAVGSSVGQMLRLSDERIKNLVACGAAAGIAATFNAPIAGVAFATEVLLSQLHMVTFSNVVISAVTASIVSQIFLGSRPAFEVTNYMMQSPWEIFLYVLLGLVAALVGIMFIKMLSYFEDLFDNWRFHSALKPAIGALLLGILGFLYHQGSSYFISPGEAYQAGMPLNEHLPHVYGSGFGFIEQVLQGQAPLVLLVALIILKPLATSFTLGSGNSGGVFAPSLFTGAVLGGAFGHLAQRFFPLIAGEVGAYALVGMAAVFAAAARAPLTSMLIVFEMSNDYHLILPLMAAGFVASAVAHWLHPDSIYTLKLTRKGIRFDQGRDLDIMQGVQVEEVMNHSPITIHKDQTLAELFAAFQDTQLQGFPVMANDDDLYGVVSLQDLERKFDEMEDSAAAGKVALGDMYVREVATQEPLTVFPDEPIWSAIRKMSPRDLARMPVVSRQSPGKLVGVISRSDILRAYEMGLVRKQQAQDVPASMALRRKPGVEFFEITIGDSDDCVDKLIADIPLPANTNLVSVQRGQKTLIPGGGTRLLASDRVAILCRPGSTASVTRALRQGTASG